MKHGPISGGASTPTKATQRRNREEAKERRHETREKAEERRRDTRRKVLVGEVFIDAADENPALQARVETLLENDLIRPGDRELFGLPADADSATRGAGGQRATWSSLAVSHATPDPLILPNHWHEATVADDPLSTAAMRLQADIRRRNRLAAKIRERSRQLVSEERRRETRRKILIGAVVLRAAADNPALRSRVLELLDSGLDRDDKRELFDLSPLDVSPAPGRAGGPSAPLADLHRPVSTSVTASGMFNTTARRNAVASR